MQGKIGSVFLMTVLLASVLSCVGPSDEELYSSQLLKSEVFRAEPSVIKDCLGENGRTTLYWDVPEVRRVEVHVDSPEGNLFALSGAKGSKETGYWVKDGMKFVLLDADTGKELATISVKVLYRS